MAYNLTLIQALAVYLSSVERTTRGIDLATGVEYTDVDSSGRVRKFRYMRNVSGATLGAGEALVPSDDEGVSTPATVTLTPRMPIYVCMGVCHDDDFGWFQVEGVVDQDVVATTGAAISVGSWLTCVNNVRTMAVDAASPRLGHAIALEASTETETISVLLPYR